MIISAAVPLVVDGRGARMAEGRAAGGRRVASEGSDQTDSVGGAQEAMRGL